MLRSQVEGDIVRYRFASVVVDHRYCQLIN